MAQPRMKGKDVTNSPSAILFGEMLDRHPEYPQRQLAIDTGFSTNSASTIFTQIKAGRTILPMRYIKKLCFNLQEDPTPLFDAMLREHYPEIVELLELTNTVVLSDDEVSVIKAYRMAKIEREMEHKKKMLSQAKKALTDAEELTESQKADIGNAVAYIKTQFVKDDCKELTEHFKACLAISGN